MKIVAVLYPGGPAAKDTPELLGCAENALGLREMVEARGHELVAITDTGGGVDEHIPTADVLIATPFWPAYITRERIERAPDLRLLLTAGVGSDHFDLAAGGPFREAPRQCDGFLYRKPGLIRKPARVFHFTMHKERPIFASTSGLSSRSRA